MAATLWKGSVSFGLVSIPVGLAAATESKSISFRQVHAADGARITHQRRCSVEDRPVPWEEVAKGYELPDGRMVVLTEDELADLPLPTAHTIEVDRFVSAAAVDPIYFDRSYYLQPDPAGLRAFALLREALQTTGRFGLAKVAIRTRERLAVLRPYGPTLCLVTLLWPDEVRPPDADLLGEQPPALREQERDMATQLVTSMSADTFDPDGYQDTYRQTLEALIEAKAAGEQITVPPPRAEEPLELAEALRASLAQARRRR